MRLQFIPTDMPKMRPSRNVGFIGSRHLRAPRTPAVPPAPRRQPLTVEGPDAVEVLGGGAIAGEAGDLQHGGQLLQAGVTEEGAEGRRAHGALADVLVAV